MAVALPSPVNESQFFGILFAEIQSDERIEVRIIEDTRNGRVLANLFFASVAALLAELPQLRTTYQQPHNGYSPAAIFYGVAPRVGDNGRKENVRAVTVLWADLDSEASAAKLAFFPLPPSIIVASGGAAHKRHLYWLLDECESNLKLAERTMQGIGRWLGGDHVQDRCRILRAPGSLNCKNGEFRPCAVTEFHPERRYCLGDFEEFVAAEEESGPHVTLGEIPDELPEKFRDLLETDEKLLVAWNGKQPNLNDRSRRDLSLASLCVALGLSDVEVASVLICYKHGKARERGHDYVVWTIGRAHVRPKAATFDGAPQTTEEAKTEETSTSPALEFVSFAEVSKRPAHVHVIEDALYRGGITVLAGESAAGKSFVAMNVGAAVAEGHNWHGRAVEHGSVAYIVYEADALEKRVQALKLTNPELKNLYACEAYDPLSPSVRYGVETPSIGESRLVEALTSLAKELEAAGKPTIALVVIDTYRASSTGSEDSSESVSAYLRVVRRLLATLPDAGCLLIHHTGWQDGEAKRKRERGSSAFRGNVEVTLYLEVIDDDDPAEVLLDLKTLKARDSERRVPMRLIRKEIKVGGLDRWGQPKTSCVIESDPVSFKERQEEAAEAAASAHLTVEKELLDIIREYALSGQDALCAMYPGDRKEGRAALARLLRKKLIRKEMLRSPFELTTLGEEVLG